MKKNCRMRMCRKTPPRKMIKARKMIIKKAKITPQILIKAI